MVSASMARYKDAEAFSWGGQRSDHQPEDTECVKKILSRQVDKEFKELNNTDIG